MPACLPACLLPTHAPNTHPLASPPCSAAQQSPPGAPPRPGSCPTPGASSFLAPGPTLHHLPDTHPSHSRPAVLASHGLLRLTSTLSLPLRQSSPSRTGAHVRAWHGAGEGALPHPTEASAHTPPECPATLWPGSRKPHTSPPGTLPTHPGCPRPSSPARILFLCALTPVGGHPRA